MIKTLKKATLCLAMLCTQTAFASIVEYTQDSGTFGNGGTYDSIYTRYDSESGVLTWEVENARKDGNLMDSFWLVLNDGPNNPKGDDGLAIFYADFVDSDARSADSQGLWAYEYNGRNSPNSYRSTEFLGDLSSGLTDNGNTLGFSIDVSSIYSQLDTSVPYGEQIGIWFHPTWGATSQVDHDNGGLSSWTYNDQSWYDRSGRPTASVPEPGSLALLGLGLLGLGLARRKKA